MQSIIATIILCVMLVSCKTERPKFSDEVNVFASADKVVAYRFTDRSDIDSGSSLLGTNGNVNIKWLDKLKVKQKNLTNDQIDILLQSVYESSAQITASACYEPHHIFLFYDSEGKIINAVEVCFQCRNVSVYPQAENSQWVAADFKKLAKLCDDIGVGMTSGTADDFIREWEKDD